MPTGCVEKPNTVFLNGRLYPTRGSVTRQVANQFAPKTVIGEFSEASDPVLSAITQDDWRGGMGRHVFDLTHDENTDPLQFKSFWDGNINNNFTGHAFPQKDEGFTPAFWAGGTTGTVLPLFGATFKNQFWSAVSEDFGASYAVYGSLAVVNAVVRYTAANPISDMDAGMVGGLGVLAVAENNSRIAWTRTNMSDSDAWNTDSGTNIKYIAFWRDMLWGMNNSAELFFTADASSTALVWTRVAQAEVISSLTATGLMTAKLTGDEESLVLLRRDGFDIYDNENERFKRTLEVPPASQAGRSGTVWNGSFYYPHGLSLLRWTPTGDGAIVESVGLNERDGVSDAYNGTIRSVASTPRELFMSLTAASSEDQDALYVRTAATGWTRFAQSSAASSATRATGQIYIGPAALATYALSPGWATTDSAGQINRIPLFSVRIGSQAPYLADEFPAAGSLITPWVVANANQDWVALKASVDLSLIAGSSAATSSFHLDYGLNLNEDSWTTAFSIDKANTDTFSELVETTFPAGAQDPVGLPFRSLRFRVRWENTGHETSFDLNRLSLVFEKRPKLRYLFTFDIDLSFNGKGPTGYTAKELRESFDEFLMQPTLGEFAYHADNPGGGQTYFVRAINPISQERTGQIERDIIRCTVMELA